MCLSLGLFPRVVDLLNIPETEQKVKKRWLFPVQEMWRFNAENALFPVFPRVNYQHSQESPVLPVLANPGAIAGVM